MISAFKELGYFDETKVMGDSWLDYTTTLLGMEKGTTIEEKVINRTVNHIKHYAHYSTSDRNKAGKKIIAGLNYFGCL